MDWNDFPDAMDVVMAVEVEMHKAYPWNLVLHLTSSSSERAREFGTITLLAVEIVETAVAAVVVVVVAAAAAGDDLVEEYDRGNWSMANTNHCWLLTRINIERCKKTIESGMFVTEGYWLLAAEISEISYGLVGGTVNERIWGVLVYRSRFRHFARRFWNQT